MRLTGWLLSSCKVLVATVLLDMLFSFVLTAIPPACSVLPARCRAFNEVYLPWLNDLPQQRLEAEFATLHSYLRLLHGGMGWEAVRGLMAAYVKAIIAKAAW